MPPESRAEYMRERRKKLKQLVFMVDKDKAKKLDAKLEQRKESRIDWFRKVLNNELEEDE